jgi:hypothetical protein
VTALLFLHLRQDGGNSVQNSLYVDVNLPIPFLHLQKIDGRNGHNAGVIYQDVNAAEALDGAFDERLHFDALRHVDGEAGSLTAGGRYLFYDCVYTVLTPRSHDDLRSVSRKKLCSALSKSAAGSGDDYNLLLNT